MERHVSFPLIFGNENVEKMILGRKTVTRRIISSNSCSIIANGLLKPHISLMNKMILETSDISDGIVTTRVDDAILDEISVRPLRKPGSIMYAKEPFARLDGKVYYCKREDMPEGAIASSPIYMPYSYSRFKGIITDVFFSWLNDIPFLDIIEEGYSSVAEFVEAWDRLNSGKGHSWSFNHPVVVYRFEKIQQGEEDAIL